MEDYNTYKKTGLVAGPLLFLIIYNLPFVLLNTQADQVIAVAVWMIIWWVTEAVSISITALIPLTFFPLLNIMDIKTVASNYSNPIIFLFFGGFVMALAMEKVMLHKRIALNIIRITGTSPDRVVLGFMLSTAFLSMWISNTATTVVMLPIALSVIDLLITGKNSSSQGVKNFSLSVLLGVAFSANVGGIATIIGTPPNTILAGFMASEYNIEISFFRWFLIGFPFALLMIAIIYLIMVKWMYPNNLDNMHKSGNLIDNEIKKLGPINTTEKRVIIIFSSVVFLWISRTLLNSYIPFLNLSDAGISMLGAFALFTIPFKFSKGEFTLRWEDTVKLPWGILLLFGGGLALAKGLSQAGIIEMIGSAIANKEILIVLAVITLLIIVMLFMTELMSNVALVAIFAPVLAGIALGMNLPLLHLLIPVTMASSCAFMLPMATPPNAIVFASGHIKVHQMAKVGFFLNISAIILLVLFTKFLIPLLF